MKLADPARPRDRPGVGPRRARRRRDRGRPHRRDRPRAGRLRCRPHASTPAAASCCRAWSISRCACASPATSTRACSKSELKAAAAGGVTSLVCPPDTDPPLDEPGLVEMLKFRARKLSSCRLFPLGALTRGLQGEALTEMAAPERGRLRRLLAGRHAGEATPTVLHARAAVRRDLRPHGVAAPAGCRGWPPAWRPAARWPRGSGLSGVPVAAETVALHTIFELVRATGARVHLCRLSSAAGVELVRARQGRRAAGHGRRQRATRCT